MSNTFQKNFDPLSKRKISEIQIFCRASVFTRPGIRGSAVPDHHFYVWHTAGCRTPPLVPVFDPAALGDHRNVGAFVLAVREDFGLAAAAIVFVGFPFSRCFYMAA